VFFCFLISVCMIFLYSSELHLSNAGDYEYRDMMDQLNEVIQKYEETYDILLCGDMNASLHRDDRRRDRIFKKFTVESNLILPTNYPIDFTFHHHNGKSKSQIDYRSIMSLYS
jgi:exonuclease III